MHSTLNAATIQHSHSSENAHSAACGGGAKSCPARRTARPAARPVREAGQLAEQIHSARHRQASSNSSPLSLASRAMLVTTKVAIRNTAASRSTAPSRAACNCRLSVSASS
jgi:hypothetical protein